MPIPTFAVKRAAAELHVPGGLKPVEAALPTGSRTASSGGRAVLIGVAAVAVATGAAIALAAWRSQPANRVMRLIAASSRLHRKREYAASLDAAREAVAVAHAELPKTAEEFGAMLHLAGVYSATRQFEEALREIDALIAATKEVHGAESMTLIPALHAKAEVLESLGRPLAQAAEQLAVARTIRRKAAGENSSAAAFASFNLASALARGTFEEDVTARTRKELLSQTSELALEATSIMTALGEQEQAAEFASRLLELLEESEDIEAARLMQRLRDVYLENTGEEYEEPSAEE